jgi:serine/threonine protein kinase/Flp pilus assembly protein TadD
MGEVYRARDVRLGREVAIKVLPEEVAEDRERLTRFEQESRSASALNHPNIVTLYDVGREGAVSYIAMELVQGSSLRQLLASGALSVRKALAIATQLAEGLARAHAVGIVHRDLKPENVMVTADGLAKILDFGLAKLSPQFQQDGRSAATTVVGATAPGVVLGTVGYMSPEQAVGREVDFRSDQFSLGAILYELLTGIRPFHRASAVETLSAILRDEPASLAAAAPEVPEGVRWVIERCLAKDPEERYASTRDLARDLSNLRDRPPDTSAVSASAPRAPRKRMSFALIVGVAGILAAVAAGILLLRERQPSRASGELSLAILPFQNLGGRSEDQYFADGITESLITDLAKAKNLLVIARNSVFKYKGRSVDVRDVGRQLGVRYVLEGSIQRAGNSVRINAQLVDAATGYHLWAERYDRPLADIFALQDEISRRIAGSLQVALSPGVYHPASAPPTRNLEAFDAYLRGTFFAHRTTEHESEDYDRAITLFERAVELDPQFAQAHAALASAYAWKFFNADPDPKWEAKASAEVQTTLSLDSSLPEAYLARGNLLWTLAHGFPHEEAIRNFRRALEINPNLPEARRVLGRVYMHVGLFDKALEEWDRALKVDPSDTWVLLRMANLRLYQCDYARALAEYDRYPELTFDDYRAVTLDHLGRQSEALALARKLHVRNPRDHEAASAFAILLARSGDARGAEEKIALAIRYGQGLSHFHHQEYDFACAYAAMGKKRKALEWLQRSAEHGFPCYPLFAKDSYLDGLRTDPEFQAFLLRMKNQWERFPATL